MAKIIRNAAIVIFASVAVLLVSATILIHLKRDFIKKSIVETINQTVETDLSYSDFQLSLISSFPKINAQLKDVYLPGNKGLPFIYTESIGIQIDLRAIFQSKVDFRSVTISGGQLYIIEQGDSIANYDIIRGNQNDGKKALNILFRDLKLKDLMVTIDLGSTKNKIKGYIPEFQLKGKVEGSLLSIDLNGTIINDYLQIDSHQYLNDCEVALSGELEYDLNLKHLVLNEIHWKTDKLSAQITGTIDAHNEKYHIKTAIQPSPIKTIKEILPVGWKDNPHLANLNGLLSGNIVYRKEPAWKGAHIRSQLKLEDGTYLFAEKDLKIGEIEGLIAFEKEPSRESELNIESVRGKISGHPFEIIGKMTDLGKKGFQFKVDGSLGLEQLNSMVKGDHIPHFKDGVAKITGLELTGKLEDQSIAEWDLEEGLVDLENTELEWLGRSGSIQLVEVKITENKSLQANVTNFQFLDSRGDVGLTISDFAGYFQSRPSGAKKQMEINLSGSSYQIDSILHFIEVINGLPESSNSEEKENLTSYVIQINADQLLWRGAKFIQSSGILSMDNHGGIFKGEARHADGAVDFDGHYSTAGTSNLTAKINASDISIKNLFTEWNDFDQDFIQSEHLDGSFRGHLLANIFWSAEGSVDTKLSEMIAAIELENGTLSDFPALQGFSRFVNEQDLRHIQFEKMANIIWLKDGAVFLPEMFLQNNAINITVSGAHTIQQEMRYGIKLNAAQVLAEKLKGHDSALRPLPAKRQGFFNMHYLLEGHADNLKYRTDNAQVNSIFQQTQHLRKLAMEKLYLSFGELPYFEEPTIEKVTEEFIPEFPSVKETDQYEYMDGFSKSLKN